MFFSGQSAGFTLAELLIALVILGVIATFTIPKVLQNQQSSSYNAAAKEAAGMISAAYKAYQQANGASPAMNANDLTAYMNYVFVQSAGNIDDRQGGTNFPCGPTSPCLHLHNGGVLASSNRSFITTDTTSAVYYFFDPNGVYDGGTTLTSPGKSVIFFLFYNGRLTSYQLIPDTTYSSNINFPHCALCDPPWFSWN